MRVGDHQLGAAQAAPGQAAQELDPEGFCLAVACGHAQHFAPAVGVDADGHDHRDGDDLVVTPDFDVGGIEPDIRPIAFDRPVEEGVHTLIDLAAQAGDLAFADAFHAERLDQVIDGAGRDALDVGFLDHCRQRLLGHAAGLQKAWKIAAVAQLGDA